MSNDLPSQQNKVEAQKSEVAAEKGRGTGGWAGFNASVDWETRQNTPVRRFLNFLERITLAVEKPIDRIVREPQLNPLYHTGTIAVALMLVISITGVYLLMFYQFGFDASYEAVSKVEASLVGRIMRALHRYASDLAILVILLHAWRTFFMDRFRGPRWLAWVTGVVMAVFVWIIGVTGYWMVPDTRFQALNQTLIDLIGGGAGGASFLTRYVLTENAGTGWLFILLMFAIHILLSVLIGVFLWLHLNRLSRAKWMPPGYWTIISIALLFIVSVLIPLGMLPKANPLQLPGEITIDFWYLFYLPAALNASPALFWGLVWLVIVLITAIPWLLRRKPLEPIVVSAERCTGCTLCAEDCPYKAITMVERDDGKRHKYIAIVDPKMCVSCGVCIGSCPTNALTLGDVPAEALWQDTLALASTESAKPTRVVFTCERHAYQGAKAHLDAQTAANGDAGLEIRGMRTQIVPLTCISMAHPNLATEALNAGASEVHFIGCPPEDCANREGNQWEQLRVTRERMPKLKRAFADAPIITDWVPPNDFTRALESESHQSDATSYDYRFSLSNWRSVAPALLLLIVVLAAIVWLADIPYTPFPTQNSVVEIALDHRSGFPIATEDAPTVDSNELDLSAPQPTRLLLAVDDEILLDETYPPKGGKKPVSRAFEQIEMPPGEHHLQLLMFDNADPGQSQTVFDGTVTLEEGQILPLHLSDARISGGDPKQGRKLYDEKALGTNVSCRICHSLRPDVAVVGPSFAGVATRAETRVPGMSAEEYLRQSILDPNAHIVEGFSPDMAPPNLVELLTEEQVDDLVAFLMTFK